MKNSVPVEYIDAYDFDVREESAISTSGVEIPNLRVLIRNDTNTVVGNVKSNYNLLTHKEAINPIIESAEKLGYTVIKNIRTSGNGSKMFASLYFKEFVQVISKDDECLCGVHIINSLDGTKRYVGDLSIWRQICSNGMRASVNENLFNVIHSKNISWDEYIKELLDEIYQRSANTPFHKWSQINIDDPIKFIEQFTDSNVSSFPRRYNDKVEMYLKSEPDNTVWNLYNAFQSVIFHNIIGEKNKVERGKSLEESLFSGFLKLYG